MQSSSGEFHLEEDPNLPTHDDPYWDDLASQVEGDLKESAAYLYNNPYA